MPISPAVDTGNRATVSIARIRTVAVISPVGARTIISAIAIIIRLITARIDTITVRLVNGAALGQ